MTRPILLLLCLTLGAQSLTAQQPVVPGSPPLIKYGKWATLAAAVTMNVLAARAHTRADDAFHVITLACVQSTANCATLDDGRYADPLLEQKFQESLRYDRNARGWLIGGETALVGTAVMFIWELTRSKSRPRNIPFEPEVRTQAGQTTIGLHVPF
ncbi:MAG: hypothetical protein ABI836_02105 [Gemmatimonadota bacterium]